MASRLTPAWLVSSLVSSLSLFLPSFAHAEPWFGWGQGAIEERFEDGDIDAEDLLSHTSAPRKNVGAETSHRQSWIGLGVFYTVLRDGSHEVGGTLVAGIALDRIAQGNVHRTGEVPLAERFAYDRAVLAMPPSTPPAPGVIPKQLSPLPNVPAPPAPAPPAPAARPVVVITLTPEVARRAVAAAWKASGLGVDDARIDAMISRARASALLPEARLRAMRVLNDTSKVDAIPDTTGTYLAVGANLWLEGRLTWRLDRVLFADDEPTLERVRIERHDARTRVAAKVIEALFLWQRAVVRQRRAAPESQELVEAVLQEAEAAATLDVLTGGWFGGWRASQEPASRSPP